MATPLIGFYAPQAGDGRGAPQIMVGDASPSPIGSNATYVRYPDRGRPGAIWTVMFVDLSLAAEQVLLSARQVDPIWPAVGIASGKQTVWDGMTNTPGAKAAKIGKNRISWMKDAAGIHACVASNKFETDPQHLILPFVEAGLIRTWATVEGHERRWLLANLAVIAPEVEVPADIHLDELRKGVAHIAGFGSEMKMLTSGMYDPKPHINRSGNVEFTRIRMRKQPKRFVASKIVYAVSPTSGVGGLFDVLRSGMLLSQRRRRVLGTRASYDDKVNADAGYAPMVTFDMEERGRFPNVGFMWSRPTKLLGRLDFGLVPDVIRPDIAGQPAVDGVASIDPTLRTLKTREPAFPQVGVLDSLDLYGPHGPDVIFVRDEREQMSALRVLNEIGVVAIGNKPVADVVQINPQMTKVAVPV